MGREVELLRGISKGYDKSIDKNSSLGSWRWGM